MMNPFTAPQKIASANALINAPITETSKSLANTMALKAITGPMEMSIPPEAMAAVIPRETNITVVL